MIDDYCVNFHEILELVNRIKRTDKELWTMAYKSAVNTTSIPLEANSYSYYGNKQINLFL